MSSTDSKPRFSILVTGADGFVGGHLAKELAALGHSVHAVGYLHNAGGLERGGHAATHLYESERLIDLRNFRQVEWALNVARPDVIIHMAAISQVKDAELIPYQTYLTNSVGTLNVLEVMRRMPKRPLLITASTDKVYGEGTGLSEESILRPLHPYDASKAAGDLMAQSYGKFFSNMPVVITRCANIYGPGDTNWQRLIPGVVRDIIAGRRPHIRSDGRPVREYLFIDDFFEAICSIIDKWHPEAHMAAWQLTKNPNWAKGETFNLGGQSKTVLDVVNAICSVMLVDDVSPDITGQSKTESDCLGLDGHKFGDIFGWRWTTDLEKGLVPTISWLAGHLNAGDWKHKWMQRLSIRS